MKELISVRVILRLDSFMKVPDRLLESCFKVNVSFRVEVREAIGLLS